MRVQDVMTRDVQTMAPDDSAENAWELMRAQGFHHVVVTSGSGAVLGILSDRDSGGTRGSSLRRGRTVEELMTRHVVTVDPSITLRRAANLMRGRSIGCVVVTNRGKVVGIVTVADLLELFGRGTSRPVPATKRWTLKHRTPHRKRVAPTGSGEGPSRARSQEKPIMTETITRILVPVDFSPHADRAFRYAATLAHRLGAKLTLLHVVEDPFLTGAWTSEIYVPNVPELLENLVAAAKRQLATLKESAAAVGVTAETTVTTGRPSQTIVDHAKDGGFDLIVMGTHGRTGLSHVVMGSIAERVLRKAPCPVLTMTAGETTEANTRPAAA